MRRNDPFELGDGAVGGDSPLDLDRERLQSALVEDVQQLEDAAILGRDDWKSSAQAWFGRQA